ncbi:LysR family transcriptional regulator [Actinopolymorpha sp. B17G11]|uniref:LysR family transcriptional regulator n=1 Tax=Actinopolymorpha sp. B17G11 TaxID=3160861 RepID=UPI0032E3E79B
MLDVARLRVLAAVAKHGSVTAAARELHYAQPSVSHHLARLEVETGARLVQRAGRGIRLTEAGRMLAARAEEILGRLDAAEAELAAHVGLRRGRVRLAAFPSALGTVVPVAVRRLEEVAPGVELSLAEAEPPEGLAMLRSGEVDVALVFRHGDDPDEGSDSDLRLAHLLDEAIYVVTRKGSRSDGPRTDVATFADESWVAGCERCRADLVRRCGEAGFAPRIAYTTDDYVAVQALVAAGMGVTTLPALALTASRHPGVRIDRLHGSVRHVAAATYGHPPDPPAAAALVSALQEVCRDFAPAF